MIITDEDKHTRSRRRAVLFVTRKYGATLDRGYEQLKPGASPDRTAASVASERRAQRNRRVLMPPCAHAARAPITVARVAGA